MNATENKEQQDEACDYILGELWAAAKDQRLANLRYDRIAWYNNTLMFASVYGDSHYVKQFRALLGTKTKGLVIEARGPKCFRPRDVAVGHHWLGVYPGTLHPSRDGYTLRRKELEHGKVHATFTALDRGFMINIDRLALLRQIKRSTIKHPITTPFIVEWLDYVETELRDQFLLDECYSYRCNCGVFQAGSNALEAIIKTGLENHEITIPDPPVVPKVADQIIYVPEGKVET